MKKKDWVILALLPLPVIAGYALFRLIGGKASMNDKGKFDFNSIATRELRQNNLLGVSVSSTWDWVNVDLTKSVPGPDGVSTPGVDNKKGDNLVIFQTFQDGMNAAAWLLIKSGNYFGNGDNDIISIGNHWAGDKNFTNPLNLDSVLNPDKRQVSDYAYSLWKVLKGYGLATDNPFASLHFATDGEKVMKSLARMENGTIPVALVPDEMYQAAVAYAIS